MEELKNGRGKQFDPHLVDILIRLIKEEKIDVDALYGNHVDVSKFFEEDGEGDAK